jgi:transcriptional regulator with XRE-family HTH domain
MSVNKKKNALLNSSLPGFIHPDQLEPKSKTDESQPASDSDSVPLVALRKNLRKLGEIIRKHRQAKGLSLDELAAEIGIHRGYLSAIERGKRNFTLVVLQDIARALSLKPGDLVGAWQEPEHWPVCTSQFPKEVKKAKTKETLFQSRPELKKEWHPARNQGLNPDNLTYRNSEKAWWICRNSNDHLWKESIRVRCAGNACPFCSKVRLTDSFADLYPKLASQWHPEKNKKKAPQEFLPSSNELIWWQCEKNPEHAWRQTIAGRVFHKLECHFCAMGIQGNVRNSIAVKHPKLAKQWHQEKNGELRSTMIEARSKELVWWQCPERNDHVWQERVCARTATRFAYCPFCTGKKILESDSFMAVCPDLAALWHASLNGKKRPIHFMPKSGARIWWQCVDYKDHVWLWPIKILVYVASNHTPTCPFCRGTKK